MVLLMFALVLGILAYDGLPATVVVSGLSWWIVCLVMIVPKLLLLAAEYGMVAWGLKQFSKMRGNVAVQIVDRSFRLFALFATALYALDLAVGGLTLIRRAMGDLILLDELTFMLPTLCVIVLTWAIYYPIEKRLREAVVISRADAGLPVYPIPSRRGYVISQLRHYGGLILLPLLVLLTWDQIVTRLCSPAWHVVPDWAATPLFMGGALVVFLVAPLIVLAVWRTAPIAPGELRDDLKSLCDRYRIRVRQLLLWRTEGLQINAAVMGIFAPTRFIMLTDALLETVPRREIRAVMAHEIAHIRHHHMFWLLGAAAGCLGLIEMAADWLLTRQPGRLSHIGALSPGHSPLWLSLIVFGVLGGIGWDLFGFIYRRFERQADTFAVQHLASVDQSASHVRPVIGEEHALAMIDALGRIGASHPGGLDRHDWRHGSIRWRQNYLRSLVGQPVDRLAIDRQIRWINAGSVLAILFLALISMA